MAMWGMNLQTAATDARDGEAESPFTEKIRSAKFPKRFNIPSMTPYKGNMDPKSNIESFVLLMEVQGVIGDAFCKVFPLTLSGSAILWFRSLAPRSIDSFLKLRKSFHRHFKGASLPKKTIWELRLMKQGEDESLKAFVERYHNMVLEVGGYESLEALESFKGALKVGRLWTHLSI